jgi:hypothetical protein
MVTLSATLSPTNINIAEKATFTVTAKSNAGKLLKGIRIWLEIDGVSGDLAHHDATTDSTGKAIFKIGSPKSGSHIIVAVNKIYNIRTSSKTLIVHATSTPLKDIFGTNIFGPYPTVPGMQERAISLTAENVGLRAHFNGASWIKKAGYLEVHPGSDGLGRVGLNSPIGQMWVNVAIYGYLIWISGEQQFQIASRGGWHYSGGGLDAGLGTKIGCRFIGGLGSEFETPDSARFTEELGHPAYKLQGSFGGTRKIITSVAPGHNIALWQGYGLVLRNIRVSGTLIGVRMEQWLDVNCGSLSNFQKRNDWKMINWYDEINRNWTAADDVDFKPNFWPSVDASRLAANPSAKRLADDIVTTGGTGLVWPGTSHFQTGDDNRNDAYIRFDPRANQPLTGTVFGLRDFICRPIAPISV